MATAVGRVARHAHPRASPRWARPFEARRTSMVATLRAQLHLAAGERVLTKVTGPDGSRAVGTQRALYWRAPGAGWVRLGWEQISRIELDRASGNLVLTGLSGGIASRATLPVPATRRLLAFIQERVAATRIILTHVAVDGRALWVDGRRQPATGRAYWFVRLDDDLDPGDPTLPGTIDRAVAELRAALGV